MIGRLQDLLRSELRPRPLADWLRLVGGIALAVGTLALVLRKSGPSPDWSDWSRFAGLAAPCAALYLLAFAAGRADQAGPRSAPWPTVFFIIAVAILPLALEQLLDALEHPDVGSGSAAWISFATAAAAAVAAVRTGSAFLVLPAVLLAALGALFLIDWAADPELETVRRLAFAAGACCALFGAAVHRRSPAQAAYAIDSAGVLAVTAASVGALAAIVPAQVTPFRDTSPLGSGNGWEALLLLSSMGLVAYAAATRIAGPGYIGSVGLGVFVVAVGFSPLARLASFGEEPGLAGWPAILIVGGLVTIALSLGFWRLFYESPGAQSPDTNPNVPAGETPTGSSASGRLP